METPKRSQKEIAQSYRGNLAYLRKFHPFRTLRTVLFVAVVLLSVGAALGFRSIGRQKFFSTGPISANHAKYADRCEVCHTESEPDLLKAVNLRAVVAKVQEGKVGELVQLASLSAKALVTSSGHDHGSGAVGRLRQSLESLASYDAACIRCHEPYTLHQPAASALNLRDLYTEIGVVHAGSCSTCHREHQGPEKMPLPPSNNCATCHNDLQQLTTGLQMIRSAGRLASPRAEVRTFDSGPQADGVRRFIPPRAGPHQPVAFASFAGQHPAFGYEEPTLSDPAHISYNHLRHRQADVVGLNNRQQMDCIQCHKLGADGVYMQRVDFNSDCRRCHSLAVDPTAAQIEVPHGRPSDVRTFLQTLGSQYLALARAQQVPPEQQRDFVNQHLVTVQESYGYKDPVELERGVFYQADRPALNRITSKSNTGEVHTACTKCHEVPVVNRGELPKITPTNVADRWFTRGPFTHQPHLHMECADCHAPALASSRTSDILMPGKALCADCHRPLKQLPADPAIAALPLANKNALLVAQQRREGGIAAECSSCHGKFHSTGAAVALVKGLVQKK